MTIRRNKTSNSYCGPAAIAALAGVHVDDAAYALRIASGARAVKGTLNRHMLTALANLGCKALPVPLGISQPRPTLAQALRGVLRTRKPASAFLVVITGHYVVIRGRKLWDNKHPEGVFLGDCGYARRRVKAIWAVEAGAVDPVPPPPRRKAMGYRRFVAELAKLNLTTDSSNVDAPNGFTFSGNGCHAVVLQSEDWAIELGYVETNLPLEPCFDPNCDVCVPDDTCTVIEIKKDGTN